MFWRSLAWVRVRVRRHWYIRRMENERRIEGRQWTTMMVGGSCRGEHGSGTERICLVYVTWFAPGPGGALQSGFSSKRLMIDDGVMDVCKLFRSESFWAFPPPGERELVSRSIEVRRAATAWQKLDQLTQPIVHPFMPILDFHLHLHIQRTAADNRDQQRNGEKGPFIKTCIDCISPILHVRKAWMDTILRPLQSVQSLDFPLPAAGRRPATEYSTWTSPSTSLKYTRVPYTRKKDAA